jgi:hypothetical protein
MMSNYKDQLLFKYISKQTLDDFEVKMLKKYVDKTNLSTYFQYEDRPECLNENYREWAKLKVKQINQELKQDKNLMKFLDKQLEVNNDN